MVKNLAILIFIVGCINVSAQKRCSVEEYMQQEFNADPTLKIKMDNLENFTRSAISSQNQQQRNIRLPDIIKIPVVVHVLYRSPEENVSSESIAQMLIALNRDFAKQNADTVNTPAVFKSSASDMGFEFKLATMDPWGVSTSGIIRRYTPIRYWLSDDAMKFDDSYGSDGWDSKSYLNVWICNMKDVLGYSTFPGLDAKKDGIVISLENFQNSYGSTFGLNDYRTIVHEVGHWLNLKHIWGDGFCGDDGVADTPQQSTYTPGCPTGSRISCNNAPTGDMYMNYMDFTYDPCMNMFSKGQRERARAQFEVGGPRNAMLSTRGLYASQILGAPVPDFHPTWLHPQVYPNPANSVVNVYFDYDVRWMGKDIMVVDMLGRVVMTKKIDSKIQQFDVSKLNSGVYYIYAKKDEEFIKSKFVKL